MPHRVIISHLQDLWKTHPSNLELGLKEMKKIAQYSVEIGFKYVFRGIVYFVAFLYEALRETSKILRREVFSYIKFTHEIFENTPISVKYG